MHPIIYAIGDIHGRIDLLVQLHDHIKEFHQLMYSGRDGQIVHIGDYIDGGSHSVEVIDHLMSAVTGLKTICLLGNHEAMMLECLETENRQAWYTWLSNGGDETLSSLGVFFKFGEYDPVVLSEALGQERIAWLQSLPLSYVPQPDWSLPYVFVHAGIAPGVALNQQNAKDLLWIRGRFLESEADHGLIVVHGHTPADEPVVKSNRICVDTGATSNGVLTAAVLDGNQAPLFLRATGRPGKTA